MSPSRRIFTVFLASPSDLEVERSAVDSVVDLVNRSIANLIGWHIDLRLWEETPPSFGRPQASINPLVDECDLFIGLLWQRWGQPTGIHSSGFEEEFERAKARRKASGAPEIWLVFKDVDESKLKDPGEQLKKVIEFKELQVRLAEVMFKQVKDSEDWKLKLTEWLLPHIFRFASASAELPTQTAIAAPALNPPRAEATRKPLSLRLSPGPPVQLRAVSAALSSAAADNTGEIFATDTVLSEFQVARIFLLSGTLLSRRYTGSVFGVHEINLLYKHRQELDAAIDEKLEILRSMLGTKGNLCPGWYWFPDLEEQQIYDLLFKFAIDDRADDVRIAALELLTKLRFEIPRDSWLILPLQHESWKVQESALNYIAEMGDESAIEFLDNAATSTDDSLWISRVRDARFRALLRLNPNAAFAEVLSKDDFVPSERAKLLDARVSSVGERVLLEGVESPWEPMRRICSQELTRRGCLPIPTAHKLVQDASLPIRAIALQSLAERGKLSGPRLVREALKDPEKESRNLYRNLGTLLGSGKTQAGPDADSIILTFYSTQSPDVVIAAVDWFSSEGRLAYKALALNHFALIEPNIVQDLAEGFSRVKQESLRWIESADGPDVARQWESGFKQLEDFISSQFREAALLGIAKNGLPGAAEIAKPYLSQESHSLRDAAVKVVSKFGDSRFEDDLLAIAKDTYGETQKEAASGALKLASNPAKTAVELLRSGSTELAKAAFSWMICQDSEDFSSVFSEFLHSDDAGFRLQSLFWLSRRLQKNDLEALLIAYIENGTYYYDVVTWLDRLLYAPSRFRDLFVQELEKESDRPR